MSTSTKSKFKEYSSSEKKSSFNNKQNRVNQKIKDMQALEEVKYKIPEENEEFSSRVDLRRREKLSENNIRLMINKHNGEIINSEAVRMNTLSKSPPPNKFESTVSSDPAQEMQNRQSICDSSINTKTNMIKIKHRAKKRNQAAVSPLVEKQSMVSISNISSYELPKKFINKYQTIKQQSENSGNLEEGYKEMESILGNKNISYGYGDSKNREKVLKFITDMKNKQKDEKEKTVNSVKERMANIDQLINGLENDYAHFSYEVGMCEEGLNELKKVTEDNDYKNLRNFIEAYDDINDYVESPEEFQDYVNELWYNHAELEKELEVERKDHNWDIRVLEHELQSKIDWIQNKTSLYIETLEQAMNEVKMNKNREIERLNLVIADAEGHRMREIIPDEEIKQILKLDHTFV